MTYLVKCVDLTLIYSFRTSQYRFSKECDIILNQSATISLKSEHDEKIAEV